MIRSAAVMWKSVERRATMKPKGLEEINVRIVKVVS